MYSKFQSHHCKLLDLFLSSQTKFNVANLEGCIPKQGPSSPGSCLLYLHFAVGQCPFLRQAIVGPFMEDHLLPHSGTVSGSPCTACLTGRAQATQSCKAILGTGYLSDASPTTCGMLQTFGMSRMSSWYSRYAQVLSSHVIHGKAFRSLLRMAFTLPSLMYMPLLGTNRNFLSCALGGWLRVLTQSFEKLALKNAVSWHMKLTAVLSSGMMQRMTGVVRPTIM